MCRGINVLWGLSMFYTTKCALNEFDLKQIDTFDPAAGHMAKKQIHRKLYIQSEKPETDTIIFILKFFYFCMYNPNSACLLL